MDLYYIIPLNCWLTGHPENFKIKLLFSEKIKSSIYQHPEATVWFIYAPSEITNIQKDQFFKGHS